MPDDNLRPASERITVRRYQPGDETAIIDLFARSFSVPRTLEHWRWKYEDDPYGREHISVAFDGDRLVGHYAGYPVAFTLDARELIAHQIADVMTDPSARHIGRGSTAILGRTVNHFFQTFCEGAIAFNYGFTAGTHHEFTIRFLKSEVVLPVAYRILRRRGADLPRWSRWVRGYQLELVKTFGKEFDDFFLRVSAAYGFLVRRDARYLNWRYSASPDTPYIAVAIRKWGRLTGWIVYRVRNDRLWLGDLLFDSRHPDALDIAIRHIMSVHRVDIVDGWFPSRPSFVDLALKRIGFEEAEEPQKLSLMCNAFTMSDAAMRMRDSLYYTSGDSDLF